MTRLALLPLLAALLLLCACPPKGDAGRGKEPSAQVVEETQSPEPDETKPPEPAADSLPQADKAAEPAAGSTRPDSASPAAQRRLRALALLSGSSGHYDLDEAVRLIEEGVAELDPYSIMYKAVIERYHLKNEDYELPADFKDTSLNAVDAYAAAGDPEAQYLLSRYMYTFRYPNTALTIFRSTRASADAGFEYAAGFLGYLYTTTLQEGPHFEDAREWLSRAANDGHADAMYQLGYLYGQPDWDKQDLEEAYRWFTRSAERDYPFAYWALGWCHESGSGAKQDYAAAAEWYRKGVSAGNPESMYSLGLMYAQGRGVERDEAEARELLERSAALGEKRAIDELAKMGLAPAG